MDNTLLISLSHQLARQRQMDIVAGNLANMSTGAYKREATKFETYVHASKPSQWQRGPQSLDFVQMAGTLRDLSEGALKNTGNPFDLAIAGNGYFAVQTTAGLRYTRNGHFTLDSEGQIITENGDLVQADGGAITIANEDGNVVIGPDGTVSGDQGQIGRIRVVQFANPRQLAKEGDSTYNAGAQIPLPAETNYRVEQGMLEDSNINPISEMTDMIKVMRSYRAISNLMESRMSLRSSALTKLSNFSSSNS